MLISFLLDTRKNEKLQKIYCYWTKRKNAQCLCLLFVVSLQLTAYVIYAYFLFYRIMYTVAQRIGMQLVIFHSHFSNKAVVKET